MREEMEEAMLHQIEEAVGDLQKRLDVRAWLMSQYPPYIDISYILPNNSNNNNNNNNNNNGNNNKHAYAS
jgi:hypothetical protein